MSKKDEESEQARAESLRSQQASEDRVASLQEQLRVAERELQQAQQALQATAESQTSEELDKDTEVVALKERVLSLTQSMEEQRVEQAASLSLKHQQQLDEQCQQWQARLANKEAQLHAAREELEVSGQRMEELHLEHQRALASLTASEESSASNQVSCLIFVFVYPIIGIDLLICIFPFHFLLFASMVCRRRIHSWSKRSCVSRVWNKRSSKNALNG